jgi:hypothetical protein
MLEGFLRIYLGQLHPVFHIHSFPSSCTRRHVTAVDDTRDGVFSRYVETSSFNGENQSQINRFLQRLFPDYGVSAFVRVIELLQGV